MSKQQRDEVMRDAVCGQKSWWTWKPVHSFSLYHHLVWWKKATASSKPCIRSLSVSPHPKEFCCLGPEPALWYGTALLSTGPDSCERAALEKELSTLGGLCPSFAQQLLLCSGHYHSPELCCWDTCAWFNTFLILTLIPAHWFGFLAWSQTCLVTVDFLISPLGWLWLLSPDPFGYGRAAPWLARSVPLPTLLWLSAP